MVPSIPRGQLTLYPLVNLVPFTGNTSTSLSLLDTHKVLVHQKSKHKSPHCGEPPRTHSLPLCFQHQSPITKSPRAALWQVFIGSGAAYSFARSANQLEALYLLYLGFQPLTDTRTKMRQNQRSTFLWELMLCSPLHRTRSGIPQS